jgi:uncharacterized protein YjbJ (UPF0337 family)
MRFLLRLAVLALAAVGAKSLYDRFAPRAAELKGPAGDVFGSAKDAARGIGQHAKDAAAEVVDDAKQRAGDVRDQAGAVVDQAHDEGPTLAEVPVTQL